MSHTAKVWELPGPRRFLEAVASDLRVAACVVVVAPPHCPEGLLREINARIGGDYSWREVDLGDEAGQGDTAPEDVLGQYAGIDGRSAHAVLTKCEGYLFAVAGVDEKAWPKWRAFVDAFAHEARNSDQFDQPRLLLIVDAACARDLQAEPAISVHRWRGTADRLDCLIAASLAASPRDLDPTEKALIVSVAAEVSVFDPSLAYELGCASLDEITDVDTLMTHIGECSDGDGEPDWSSGTADECEGEMAASAGCLCAAGDRHALRARIWRGQIAVLLPLVERERLRLYAAVSRFVTLPFPSNDGKILESERDFQIGHIDEVARRVGPRLAPQVASYIRELRVIRNALAHMDVVSAATVTNALALRASAAPLLEGPVSAGRTLVAARR